MFPRSYIQQYWCARPGVAPHIFQKISARGLGVLRFWQNVRTWWKETCFHKDQVSEVSSKPRESPSICRQSFLTIESCRGELTWLHLATKSSSCYTKDITGQYEMQIICFAPEKRSNSDESLLQSSIWFHLSLVLDRFWTDHLDLSLRVPQRDAVAADGGSGPRPLVLPQNLWPGADRVPQWRPLLVHQVLRPLRGPLGLAAAAAPRS